MSLRLTKNKMKRGSPTSRRLCETWEFRQSKRAERARRTGISLTRGPVYGRSLCPRVQARAVAMTSREAKFKLSHNRSSS